MKYEVVITGSSRPTLYPDLWESFNNMVIMKEKPIITVYEDVILADGSAKVKEFIKNKVDKYIEIKPNIRLGRVFNMLLDNIKCEYFVYLQDDWKFLKKIDIDLLIDIMDKNKNIKQIWFPKKLTQNFFSKQCKVDVKIDGVNFVPFKYWTFLPSITRTSYIKKVWKKGKVWKNNRPESDFRKAMGERNDVSYMLGKKFDEYVQHLGEDNLRSTIIIRNIGKKK